MADNNQNGQNQKPGLSWSQPPATQNTPSSRPTPPTGGMNNRPGATPPENKSASVWWITAGVVVVLALIIWAFVAARGAGNATSGAMENATSTDMTGSESSSTSMTMPMSTSTTTTTTTSTSGAAAAALPGTVPVGMSADASQLTVPTPQAAGTTVAVSNIIVSEPTWVVVYEDNNGKLGNALGAALFISGRTSGTVDLLRGTLSGQTYFAAEALDSGNRVFSLKDAPVLDQNGQQVLVQFETN